MKLYLLLFCVIAGYQASAQTDVVLQNYLATHHSSLVIEPDSSYTFSTEAGAMIGSVFAGKRLLVLAENTSHQLGVYKKLRPALIGYLAGHGLKYVFIEYGRSVAYCINAWLDGDYKLQDNMFYSISERQRVKKAMGTRRSFAYKGIDFERGFEFYDAVNNLLSDVALNSLHESRSFIARIEDIGSQKIPADSSAKITYRRFHNFYQATQEEFYRDSVVIKRELGSHYTGLKYLLTNPNNQLPPWAAHKLFYDDRDPEMAENLLRELDPQDTTSVYLLSTGYAHTIGPSSLVGKVGSSDFLRNKIVILNEYCDNCSLNGQPLVNDKMHFMTGDMLTAFQKAAPGPLVLFDLSALPEQYNYIKKHGDLLLFVKNQN